MEDLLGPVPIYFYFPDYTGTEDIIEKIVSHGGVVVH